MPDLRFINHVDEKNKYTYRHYAIRVLVYRNSIPMIEMQLLADFLKEVHNSLKILRVFRDCLVGTIRSRAMNRLMLQQFTYLYDKPDPTPNERRNGVRGNQCIDRLEQPLEPIDQVP